MNEDDKIRVRFGAKFNLPVLKNALVVVVYLTPMQWEDLQSAVRTIRFVLAAAGSAMPFELVCEASEAG